MTQTADTLPATRPKGLVWLVLTIVWTSAEIKSLGKGPKKWKRKMTQEIGFIKINRNRYITTDEQFTVLNIGGSVWVVLKKNANDNYNTMFIQEPFNRALEAMSALRKVIA